MWRHGDVFIAAIAAIPEQAKKTMGTTLAYGEITGHSHRIETPAHATLLIQGNALFLEVSEPVRIVHEEHHPIMLPPGTYRVWQQREYTPQAIKIVRD